MMDQSSERGFSTGASTLTAFIVGAAAGAVTALLMAPYSGRESRDKIKDVARSAKTRVNRIPNAMREAGSAAKGAFGETYSEETHS